MKRGAVAGCEFLEESGRMNTLSRVQSIVSARDPAQRRHSQVVRVIVDERDGVDLPKVALAPGDRLILLNRSNRTLRVAPVDFFGSAFCRFALEPGEATSPMVVTGLWFQIELLADGGRIYPLDVYLVPNGSR
jgi:hypothetical protein